jgi:phospholipid/cholesterol/gamma-HCH transport system substrate-binding protein
MRKVILTLVVVVGAACLFLMFHSHTRHRLDLTAYFADAQGLPKGAQVRLAGLRIGKVSSVRVRPEMQEHPAEVKMSLLTDYDLAIPDDSKVSVRTSGVLGETYVAIDVQGATGPRIKNGGTLKSVEMSEPSTTQLLQRFADSLNNCDTVVKDLKESGRVLKHSEPSTKQK